MWRYSVNTCKQKGGLFCKRCGAILQIPLHKKGISVYMLVGGGILFCKHWDIILYIVVSSGILLCKTQGHYYVHTCKQWYTIL